MDDKKKNKKYIIPEAEVIDFKVDDIILTSLTRGETAGFGDEDWEA